MPSPIAVAGLLRGNQHRPHAQLGAYKGRRISGRRSFQIEPNREKINSQPWNERFLRSKSWTSRTKTLGRKLWWSGGGQPDGRETNFRPRLYFGRILLFRHRRE